MEKKKIHISNLIFYVAYTLFLISFMFNSVKNMETVVKVMRYFSLGMLIINCILQSKSYKAKTIFAIIGISAIILASTFISKDITLLFILVFVLAGKNMELNKIIKYDFYLKSVLLLIVLLFYKLGVTDNYYMLRTDGTLRSPMGFSHPNVFGSYVFSICADFIYLKYKNMKVYHYIILIVAAALVSHFADSRTSLFSIALLIGIVVVYRLIGNKIFENKVVTHLVKNLILYATVLTFLITILYNNHHPIGEKVNSLSTGRIRLISVFWEYYNINLLGNEIEITGTRDAIEQGTNLWVIDNAYALLIFRYGILVFLLNWFVMRLYVKKAYKDKNYILCIIMIVFFIYGFMETGLYRIQYNTFLLFLANVLYQNENKLDKSIN